jgi:tRNA 2-thiouridine synthesizing protein D
LVIDKYQGGMLMKLGIMINEGPYTHQASDTAYLFAKAAIEKGHKIHRVFFYHDGVYNANRLAEPPQDDRHVINRWQKLAKDHHIDLVVCVAAALRRGIKDENLQEGFRISGLGQLIETGIQTDRLVTFGD